MKRICCLLAMSVISAVTTPGQSGQPSVVGVWQAVEVVHTDAQAATIKPGPNLCIFSAAHYARVVVLAQDRPALANPQTATAEQLRGVWGPFVGEAGSYELSGEVITLHPIAAKNPAAMAAGSSIVASYKLDGKTLTLTVQREYTGPLEHPFTVKFVRVE